MKHVIVGGGIAGVCCAQELQKIAKPDDQITLISASKAVKSVRTISQLTQNLEELEVGVVPLAELEGANLSTLQAFAQQLDPVGKVITLNTGERVQYDKVCLCTGAVPKVAASGKHVKVLRDLESVTDLRRQLAGARRILVVGNGGIALELVWALSDVEVVWSLKHGHIGDAFFDLDAAAFLLEQFDQSQHPEQAHDAARISSATEGTSHSYPADQPTGNEDVRVHEGTPFGAAAGPRWTTLLGRTAGKRMLTLEYGTTIESVDEHVSGRTWPVTVRLSNGVSYDADVVVSAVGVTPNTQWLPLAVQRAEGGGVSVDRNMQSSCPDVYAAGDCCSISWEHKTSHWFQMRLWSQARHMGCFAAWRMAELEDDLAVVNFDLFCHVTTFCGKKVILLGLYNGQRLESEAESDMVTYSRIIQGPDSSFVRVLLLRGRLAGAVLIGETDLEETFENLILDGIDLSQFGPHLLDPDVELDHMFD